MNKLWLLVLPVLALFYTGLFATIFLWYPAGLDASELRLHVVNFSIIYIFWLVVFFIYTLFDLPTFRSSLTVVSRLLAAVVTCGVVAIIYFYLQPEFILTPRRFLLVHLFITTTGISAWYALIQQLLPKVWQKQLFFHPQIFEQGLHSEVESYLRAHNMLGWQYQGEFQQPKVVAFQKTTVVLPNTINLHPDELQTLFELKRQGLEFLEFHNLVEQVHRRIDLSGLNEVWFLRSVSYRTKLYDSFKRLIDIVIGFVGTVIALLLLPILALLIKIESQGPVLFVQDRIGQFGKIFKLYKLRTMKGDITNTWTAANDARITSLGKWLRRLRLDELPQFFNILRGDMSLVGPRPEQVHITAELNKQIPYFNERHMIKPGLTGWSQLHVYANSVDATKQKLQYDLYYIKHRSFWFDLEIILRTIFHIMTFQGQ